jgi:hypothetical protein
LNNKVTAIALTVAAVAGVTAYTVYSKKEVVVVAPKAVPLKNSAFVFIKPAANNTKVQEVVSKTLQAKGCDILKEGEFTAEQIDKGMLIDQHYYAIASKATILKPKDVPVPPAKFLEAFGLTYEQALADGSVYNAIDACKVLDVDADGLDKLWASCKKVKFGGGFYCGKIEVEGKPSIYCFNAFFMTMRSNFVKPGSSIHYYVVEFPEEKLKWSDFRGKVLGPTNPADAPVDSLRGSILKDWQSLGLPLEPNVGENCVHASASPFEGLAERMNWLKAPVSEDPFGAALLKAGVPETTVQAWSVDPQVKGKSIFDQLEDKDAKECLDKIVELSK